MATLWTHGMYRVKPGRGDEFTRTWRALARHAVTEFGVAPPTILRDLDDPNLFVTFGVWESLDTLTRFRASTFVAEQARVLDDLLQTGEARILDEIEA
jgi:heme-degrading monooxygenase HmoA